MYYTVPDSSSPPIACPVSNSDVELDAIASTKIRYKSVIEIVDCTKPKAKELCPEHCDEGMFLSSHIFACSFSISKYDIH